MIQMVNGRPVNVPMGDDGTVDEETLRRNAGVSGDRTLIMQMPDGTNRIVNPGEKLKVNPQQYYMDAPRTVRGESS